MQNSFSQSFIRFHSTELENQFQNEQAHIRKRNIHIVLKVGMALAITWNLYIFTKLNSPILEKIEGTIMILAFILGGVLMTKIKDRSSTKMEMKPSTSPISALFWPMFSILMLTFVNLKIKWHKRIEDLDLDLMLNFYLCLFDCIYLVRNFGHSVITLVGNDVIFCAIFYEDQFPQFQSLAKLVLASVFSLLLLYVHEKEIRNNFQLRSKMGRQNKMHAHFLNSMTEPVILFGKDGGVVFRNASSHQIFHSSDIMQELRQFKCDEDMSLQEYLAQRIQKSSYPNSESEVLSFEKIFLRSIGNGQSEIFEARIVGTQLLQDCNVTGLILKNITEKAELQESKLKQRCSNLLLCGVSHKLRTPINGIAGLIKMAKKDAPPQIKEYLNQARSSLTTFSYKIEDILDHSLATAGEFVLHISPQKVSSIVKTIQKCCIYEITSKNLKLQIDIDPNISYIKTDGRRLTQVLLTLLHNAIKYTKKGKVVLSIKKLRPNNGVTFLKISVSDTGIGMDQSQINNIYKCHSLQGLDQTFLENRESGLPGIGLIVTQIICWHLETKLDIFSIKGTGSCFSFQIKDEGPVESSASDPLFYQAPPINQINPEEGFLIPEESKSDSRYKKIKGYTFNLNPKSNFMAENMPKNRIALIVDDIVLNRLVLINFLKKYHFVTIEASDGSEAVKKFKAFWKPTEHFLIMMDLQMPIMDGIESCKKIREISMNSENPFIVSATAFASEKERTKAYEAGMNDFISKPITSSNMKSIISKFNLSIV